PKPVEWLVLPHLKKGLGLEDGKYDVGSIGKLDTRILVEQYADADSGEKLMRAWRGGAYYAAGSKDQKLSGTSKIALLYLSRWNSEASADEFARIYAAYIPQRYAGARKVTALSKNERLCSS